MSQLTRPRVRPPAPNRPAPRADGEFPSHRGVAVYVTGGLDGALRVMTLLRGRRYRVRDIRVEVSEGVVESRVGATAYLTARETDLLLARLRRMPAVVSAEHA